MRSVDARATELHNLARIGIKAREIILAGRIESYLRRYCGTPKKPIGAANAAFRIALVVIDYQQVVR